MNQSKKVHKIQPGSSFTLINAVKSDVLLTKDYLSTAGAPAGIDADFMNE